ncbi:glycosyltransferase, partial [candidate division WWE3 bacterium]|nr:glycosyltransferase [candidate division WWE3 bacterium]
DIDENIPILGFVGRMEEQKGVDLIADVLDPLLKDFNVQFVAVGGGDNRIIDRLKELRDKYPHKVGVHLMPDFTLPRMVFSGTDIMLIPSRFEPCGIVQMEAMRYGAIPIVRSTGGLADTVKNYEPETDEGWGFVFNDFDMWAFFAQIIRALETYRQKDTWKKLQVRAMEQDNSWDSRAKAYEELYEKAIQIKRQNLNGKAKPAGYSYDF